MSSYEFDVNIFVLVLNVFVNTVSFWNMRSRVFTVSVMGEVLINTNCLPLVFLMGNVFKIHIFSFRNLEIFSRVWA